MSRGASGPSNGAEGGRGDGGTGDVACSMAAGAGFLPYHMISHYKYGNTKTCLSFLSHTFHWIQAHPASGIRPGAKAPQSSLSP